MMHWVVFSCFVTLETFSDVFFSWFPFYYEVKVCIVFWLLSPMTKGSSILYKKFIHPKLSRHEQEIDEYINQAKERGYKAVIDAGTKTFDYASKLIMETAIKVSQLEASFVTNHAVASTNHHRNRNFPNFSTQN
jgi:receptor expression-enhancing protein 1/2/3/4